MLSEEGFATFALGKWHLNPNPVGSAAGPYDDWPLRRGFDRFYGFLPGATPQFDPDLTYDNHPVMPPKTPEQGYHLTEDLVDHAIEFINDLKAVRPETPFFTYFATGAMHYPHQAPKAYIDKYRGPFRRRMGHPARTLLPAPGRTWDRTKGHAAAAKQSGGAALGGRWARTKGNSSAGCRRRGRASSSIPMRRSVASSSICA